MRLVLALSLSFVAIACATGGGSSDAPVPDENVAQEVAVEPPVAPEPGFVLRGARVLTATGESDSIADVWVRGERIAAIGPDLLVSPDVRSIDIRGQTLTPGIIDTHSHMGVYPAPRFRSHADGNEATNPVTAEVWAGDAYWPQDPQIDRARAGGVTTAQILPGSANLIGGRSIVVRLRPGARSAEEARFEEAPYGLKMACGENPKRVYGNKSGPSTRMGNVAGYRKAYQQAVEYRAKWDRYHEKRSEYEEQQTRASQEAGREKDEKAKEKDPPDPPARDFALETLSGVLRGEILVHNHCYRADEMLRMLALADEFGFRIQSFHHAVEAYKIADELAAADTAASMWADWWGFKAEAFDGIRENAAMVHAAGGRAIIHSDSAVGIQRLNQEAAKAMYAGRRAGLDVDENAAMRWITANPAWALGIADETGTIEVGKRADLVVWDGNPFSVYTRASQVYLDGELIYERDDGGHHPRGDFETGLQPDDLGGVHGESH